MISMKLEDGEEITGEKKTRYIVTLHSFLSWPLSQVCLFRDHVVCNDSKLLYSSGAG